MHDKFVVKIELYTRVDKLSNIIWTTPPPLLDVNVISAIRSLLLQLTPESALNKQRAGKEWNSFLAIV